MPPTSFWALSQIPRRLCDLQLEFQQRSALADVRHDTGEGCAFRVAADRISQELATYELQCRVGVPGDPAPAINRRLSLKTMLLIEQIWDRCSHGRFSEAAELLNEARGPGAPGARPRIVCLCGSTRFHQQFVEANFRETLRGNIVLSVGCFLHAMSEAYGVELALTPEQKQQLDELHLRKIDLADEVLVLNYRGYVGPSTRGEITYATAHGKPIRYLEPIQDPQKTQAPAEPSARVP